MTKEGNDLEIGVEHLSELWVEVIELAKEYGDDPVELVGWALSSANECYDGIISKFAQEKNFRFIPHYPRGVNPQIEKNKIYSLPQEWKELMIESILAERLPTKHDLMCIYGEFSDVETVKLAIKNKFNVDIVCGPKLLEEKYKEEILEIVKRNPENICIRISEERPKQHAVLIDNRHLLLESKHKPKEFYNYACIIENISEKGIGLFKSEFDKISSNCEIATEETIVNMDYY
jgi:hypothetical protein